MKQLVVFDVDGTLTQTNRIHAELYSRALREVLELEEISSDWTAYRSVTDAGVAGEIIERHRGRRARQEELNSVHDRFVALLKEAFPAGGEPGNQIPGAGRMLSALRRHPGFECALATGTWKEPLMIKLRGAALDAPGLPMATSNDSSLREDIVEMAIERARKSYRLPDPLRVTLVGDGIWDVQVAGVLKRPFIGIGTGRQAARLKQAGAEHVLADFTDLGRFMELLTRSNEAG